MNVTKILFKSAFLLLILTIWQTTILANDGWIQVRSKNFNLVGNASEQDIRQVAVKLEQFREALRQVLNQLEFNSPVPTTVIVFKTAEDYNPYKPLKLSGETNNFVTGYFQGGKDVNYITLSTAGEITRTYEIINHEFTHYLLRNNIGESIVPPWYGEGLALYYETLTIENDRAVQLGGLQNKHLQLLQKNDLIPFETFFNTDGASLNERENNGVGLFYAQAWALTHYLKHGNNGARSGQHDKFLKLLISGKSPKAAFTEAFQTDYATLEAELKNYLEKKSFSVSTVPLKDKLTIDLEQKVTTLSEAEVKAYLGDLLLHSNRQAEAEVFLTDALKLNPDLIMAQNSFGLLKVQQGDFFKAREYLEKAIQSETANYLTYFMYAYALSREGMSDFGFIIRYDPSDAEKMRQALKKAISLNPGYVESYDLFAFVCIVRNENLNEALAYINKALEISPGNQWYQIHLSELYLRKEEFSTARNIALKVAKTAIENDLRVYAQNTLRTINSTEEAYEEIKNHKEKDDSPLYKPFTEEELAQLRIQQMNESLNEGLYRTKSGEKRILGYLTRIDCRPKEQLYSIRLSDKILKFRSASFDSVRVVTFSADVPQNQIGCGEMKKEGFAVINYRPSTDTTAAVSGELVSIEFVPAYFKFLN